MSIIEQTLSDLSIGQPTTSGHLSIFPLFGAEGLGPDYLTVDEALDRGRCRITEISDSGDVPEILFYNDAEESILLFDGEELVGAKQNRVLNITILIAAAQKLAIPVSCVEAGRWGYHGKEFRSAQRHMYARGRREKMSQVSESLRASGTRRSNQSRVWQGVDAKAACYRVASPTSAMGDVYESLEGRLNECRQAFTSQPNQTGGVFFIDDQVAGLELVGSAQVFAKLFPKLVDSYSMDALEIGEEGSKVPLEATVADFLTRVSEAGIETFDALGEGHDLRLEGERIVGGALEAEERVVQLSAFDIVEANGAKNGNGYSGRIVSLAQRRRNRMAH